MKDIGYKVLCKNDKILVYMNKDTTLEECLSIWKNMQKSFPNNQVIIIHNKFIDGIDIIKDTDLFNYTIDQYLAELVTL